MIQELTGDRKIVARGNWFLSSYRGTICLSNTTRLEAGPKTRVWIGTEEELTAHRDSLPPYLSNTERAVAYFDALDAEIRAAFGELFRIIHGIGSDADKALLIAAIAVSPELVVHQVALVEILTL